MRQARAEQLKGRQLATLKQNADRYGQTPVFAKGETRDLVAAEVGLGRSVGRHLCGRHVSSTWPAGRHPCQ